MIIKKITVEDVPFLNETRNLVAQEYLHDSRTFTVDESLVWFNTFKPDYWIIWLNEERIGYFRLSNHSQESKNIYVGADIHPKFQGKGYGYQAYKKFLPILFGDYNLNKVSLEVLVTNKRAINLYHKLGFFNEGTKRQEVLKNNVYIDSCIMSMLRSEYKYD
jgi:RimJ/RimL family protein N-acetyltransferase